MQINNDTAVNRTFTRDVLGEKHPHLRELSADLETPVSIYLKLASGGPSFLLESVTGGAQVARYSFIGVNPGKAFLLQRNQLYIHSLNGKPQIDVLEIAPGQNPLSVLRGLVVSQTYVSSPGLPRFTGGLAGYMSYEMMRYFEPSVCLEHHPELPDMLYLLVDVMVVFDHAFGKLILIGNPSPTTSSQEIEARLSEIEQRIRDPLPPCSPTLPGNSSQEHANMSREQFMSAVRQVKEHIVAGDIFQAVLSQQFSRQTNALPFDIYRALRQLNPSPYMFFFNFGNLAGSQPFYLLGASPEMHVRLEGRRATIRPIAGTCRRGESATEDADLAKELLADPKERAEHVMLVDLARNDLGRICKYGSVHISEQMAVERYSHVMHIVSMVEGELRPELDGFDLLSATFPAGTVSGAPKIRAMQIIADIEQKSRGPYAGTVGYYSFDGSVDTCIAIRTMLIQGNTIYMQAGAGIVADSEPEMEYQETINKLGALMKAVEIAEARR